MIETIYQHYLKAHKVSTDSRKIEKDAVFFALKGENFDANDFALQVAEQGVASLVVADRKDLPKHERILIVDNSLKTLQDLAAYHRQQNKSIVLSITGTNGKTTTKELVSAVLAKKYNIIHTMGNLNNHIGVPLTLLSIKPETEIAVVEMGANHPGEIDFLCKIADPDYGLITNIGKAHLEGFGSFEGVIKTKTELDISRLMARPCLSAKATRYFGSNPRDRNASPTENIVMPSALSSPALAIRI